MVEHKLCRQSSVRARPTLLSRVPQQQAAQHPLASPPSYSCNAPTIAAVLEPSSEAGSGVGRGFQGEQVGPSSLAVTLHSARRWGGGRVAARELQRAHPCTARTGRQPKNVVCSRRPAHRQRLMSMPPRSLPPWPWHQPVLPDASQSWNGRSTGTGPHSLSFPGLMNRWLRFLRSVHDSGMVPGAHRGRSGQGSR